MPVKPLMQALLYVGIPLIVQLLVLYLRPSPVKGGGMQVLVPGTDVSLQAGALENLPPEVIWGIYLKLVRGSHTTPVQMELFA